MQLKSLLTKLKLKEKPRVETKKAPQEEPEAPPEPSEPSLIIEEKQELRPIKEYHETIYTKGHTPKEKKPKKVTKEETTWKPTHWDGISTIEKNVDTIHTKTNYQKPSSHTTEDIDIERKVDLLIKKKQR